MNTNDTINTLVSLINSDTRSRLPTKRKLLLFGSNDSIFLKAIKKSADNFGIVCTIYESLDIKGFVLDPKIGIVVDKETYKGDTRNSGWTIENDIDGFLFNKKPCVTRAMELLLSAANCISGKDITIVGRGHSATGMAEFLIKNNATVTVAHSKTPNIFQATDMKDVVLFCTPELSMEPSYNTKDMVIDLGFVVKNPKYYLCDYVTNIGKLTISVLINRLVRGNCSPL